MLKLCTIGYAEYAVYMAAHLLRSQVPIPLMLSGSTAQCTLCPMVLTSSVTGVA